MTQQNKSKKLPILAAALCVQAGLAGVLVWQNSQQAAITKSPLIAGLDSTSFDRLAVHADDTQLELVKKGDSWLIDKELPVKQDLVSNLVKDLSAIEVAWPVASSSSAQTRFEVSEDKFKKRVQFYQGDALAADVYIGTTPSYRQVHMRTGDDKDIFAVQFDAYKVGESIDAWMDNSLLQPNSTIRSVVYEDITLSSEGGEWVSNAPKPEVPAAPSESAETNTEASSDTASDEAVAQVETKEAESKEKDFIDALNKLVVLGVEKDKSVFDAPEANENDEAGKLTRLSFQVTTVEKPLNYELIQKDNSYYIKRSDFENVFRLSKSQFDALAAIKALHISEAPVAAELSGL